MTRDSDRNQDGRDPQGLGAKPESAGRQASPDLGRTNLTDRLGELIGCAESGYSSDRRVLAYFVVTHKDEILSALRKAEEAATAIERLTAREAELRAGLVSVIDAADSFCDCSGDEVAAQVRIRARLSLGDEK